MKIVIRRHNINIFLNDCFFKVLMKYLREQYPELFLVVFLQHILDILVIVFTCISHAFTSYTSNSTGGMEMAYVLDVFTNR